MIRRLMIAFNLVSLCFAGAAAAAEPPAKSAGVVITDLGDRLHVEIGGQLFTEYWYKDAPRPYMYPVIGPTGDPMTRNWPMKEVPGEPTDHVHHRSLWYAHGKVNGQNFWSEAKSFGKIVHQKFLKIESGDDLGVVQSQNQWVAANGDPVCEDVRTIRFYNRPGERLLDFDVTLKATNGPVTMGDTKEGSMAIRVAPTMQLKGGQGHIVTSEGARDKDAWGKRAAWCDYYGPVNGKIVGVAIFDHPQNPRHPTWWHVRDYGLFAANPFGAHDFEKQPVGAGDLTIPAGGILALRYQFYFHEGDEAQAKVAEHYKEYASANPDSR